MERACSLSGGMFQYSCCMPRLGCARLGLTLACHRGHPRVHPWTPMVWHKTSWRLCPVDTQHRCGVVSYKVSMHGWHHCSALAMLHRSSFGAMSHQQRRVAARPRTQGCPQSPKHAFARRCRHCVHGPGGQRSVGIGARCHACALRPFDTSSDMHMRILNVGVRGGCL